MSSTNLEAAGRCVMHRETGFPLGPRSRLYRSGRGFGGGTAACGTSESAGPYVEKETPCGGSRRGSGVTDDGPVFRRVGGPLRSRSPLAELAKTRPATLHGLYPC